MIVICIPYYDIIDKRTLACVEELLASDIDCTVRKGRDGNIGFRGTYIGDQRNLLIHNMTSSRVDQKLPENETHYLFLDSSNVLSVSQVKKLVSHDLDIVSAAYHPRGNLDYYCAGKAQYGGGILQKEYLPITTKGLIEVDIVGAGALLVKKNVFEELEYPWFRYEWVRFEKDGVRYQAQTGEDVGFCLHAKRNGFDVHVDCDCISEHYHD